jgi:hypothetical protein
VSLTVLDPDEKASPLVVRNGGPWGKSRSTCRRQVLLAISNVNYDWMLNRSGNRIDSDSLGDRKTINVDLGC